MKKLIEELNMKKEMKEEIKKNKITKNCDILLKSGKLKFFHFTEKFKAEFEDIYDDLYDELWEIGWAEDYRSNNDLKLEFLDILKPLFELDVKIKNSTDDKPFTSFKRISDYILNYDEWVNSRRAS